MYPREREIKTYDPIKTYTQMFKASLYLIAKKRKKSKCLSTDEWVAKLYIHITECYSAMKMNEVLINTPD